MEFCHTINSSGPEVALLIDDLRALGLSVGPSQTFTVQVAHALKMFQQSQHDYFGRPLKIDGRLGALTALAMDTARGRGRQRSYFDDDDLPPISKGGSALARKAARIAFGEYMRACGEQSGNNSGPDIARYQNNAPQIGAAWSISFVTWCFKEAGLSDAALLGVQTDAYELMMIAQSLGLAVFDLGDGLLPGDILLWHFSDSSLGSHPHWQGHAGIVWSHQDSNLITLEGDRGPYPSLVRPYRHKARHLIRSQSDSQFREAIGVVRMT